MMPPMRNYTLAAASLLLVVGCGKDPSTGGDDTTTPDADSTYQPDPGYVKLLSRTWSLGAGQTNIYKCLRYTVPTDTYITSIEAQAPIGTHHTVLSVATGSSVAGPDGEYDCSVQTLGMQMLYASGVGTSPLDFPDGVGLKIAAGTQIHLNLHLYNAGDEAITGESGIFVKTSSTPPAMLAEMVFGGNGQFTIPGTPAGQTPQPYNVSGSCTIPATMKLFALWPHMHKLATHQKIELTHSGSTTTLLDKDYSFGEQVYWVQNPMIDVVQNDKVKVTCTYVNPGTGSVSFGDGSDKEMCFGGLYRYPAQGSSLLCLF